MLQAIGMNQVRPAVLVIAPVAVLTLISATVLAVLLGRAGGEAGSAQSILLMGGATYAVAVILLIRFGLSNIGKLEDLGLTDSLASMPNRRALHLDYARAAPAACRWARTFVESTSTRRTSPKCGSAVIASNSRAKAPEPTQRRNRLYTASQAPNSPGRSRSGMPVRAM